MKFNIFGYTVTFTVSAIPTANGKLVRILKEEFSLDIELEKKIPLIKAVRRPELSKILIDSGIVPEGEIHTPMNGEPFVGLRFAKEWVEFYMYGQESNNYKFE